MAFTEPPPPPPVPTVRRFNADGTPTPAQVEYEKRVQEWMKRLAASVP